ncbi:hypothetical protein EIN_316160 [Entamoeba invadens IP1]|uniref:Uncharacterized protein n=1 Tax=Entamoeba invadens IP1 TaxID=370355 RepID=A0A0A1TZD8_ENTIV|nr:hypothetical protein EIN_316160 [Entamoeba invadens IP1]ELP86947.1 hypothetical protein EIN_316160 [Entamoeba invadens IP1]|eukprot:XP_004253718.1 hypothetical protein EIN_316160 [Entamoeba invadens IP1]
MFSLYLLIALSCAKYLSYPTGTGEKFVIATISHCYEKADGSYFKYVEKNGGIVIEKYTDHNCKNDKTTSKLDKTFTITDAVPSYGFCGRTPCETGQFECLKSECHKDDLFNQDGMYVKAFFNQSLTMIQAQFYEDATCTKLKVTYFNNCTICTTNNSENICQSTLVETNNIVALKTETGAVYVKPKNEKDTADSGNLVAVFFFAFLFFIF